MNQREFTTSGDVELDTEADLAQCDTDPIERSASIQPHGVFFGLDPDALEVRSASANVGSLLDASLNDALGVPFEDLVAEQVAERVALELEGGVDARCAYLCERAPTPAYAAIFPIGEETIGVELEPATPDDATSTRLLTDLDRRLEAFRRVDSLDVLYERAVTAVRDATGYDRVMLYRFDEDDHGRVVAEDKRDELHSYLDQHFPASDIPEPARRLYRINPLRYIPDNAYDPAPICDATGPLERWDLDLTHSMFRGVPPVHREYLDNMGVGGSMSIPLVVDGELWGLIACHSIEAGYVSHPTRNFCKVLGLLVARGIEKIEADQRTRRREAVESLRQDLEQTSRTYEQLFETCRHEASSILSVVEADAFHLKLSARNCWLGDDAVVERATELLPHVREALREREWVAVHSIVDQLDAEWPHSEVVSGLFAVRLGPTPRSYCVWFRPKYGHAIEWGDDPRKPASAEGEGISPRESFEAWTQVVADRSRRWSEFDRTAGRHAARVFKELALEVQSERLREANQKLGELNREKQELLEEIETLARTDDLTGLYNRRGLMEEMGRDFERATRYEEDLSVLLLDLDHFKRVNDTYGHRAGDNVLRTLGRLLSEQTRSADAAGRYGGEEFAVILPNTNKSNALETAERIREALRRQVFEHEGESFRVTCSIGVAVRRDSDTSGDTMIERADDALYRAKEAGRDAVEAA